MKRKPKTARPAPVDLAPAELLCFAAPDAPASEPPDAPDSLDALYDAESEANQ